MSFEYLKNQLIEKQARIKTRYNYYDMKFLVNDFRISTPPELVWFKHTLGWCADAVDSIADRLSFRKFGNDNFGMQDIFNMNNTDILVDAAIKGALISSCDFIYIMPNNKEIPKLQVIDGYNATGILDPQTNMLKEGYAILEHDLTGNPTVEAYFGVGFIDVYTKNGSGAVVTRYTNKAPYPLLVPIIYKPDAIRPFGRSVISRACMGYVQGAARTIKRSEIGAEFFSLPQKYATGISEDAVVQDRWKAAMSTLLTFTKDEQGDHPVVGSFSQQSMEPHLAQLKMFASLFAGETGLTLDDLGFPSDNPSSAEAIKASHEKLRLRARKAQKNFATGLINTGYLAACVRDNIPYKRSEIYNTKVVWEPIFEPDTAILSGIGDGAIKINQAVPNFLTKETLSELTGIIPE